MDMSMIKPLSTAGAADARALVKMWHSGDVKLMLVRSSSSGDPQLKKLGISGTTVKPVRDLRVNDDGSLRAKDSYSVNGTSYWTNGDARTARGSYLAVYGAVSQMPVSNPVMDSDRPGIVAAAKLPKAKPPVAAVIPQRKSSAGLFMVHNPDVRRVQAEF